MRSCLRKSERIHLRHTTREEVEKDDDDNDDDDGNDDDDNEIIITSRPCIVSLFWFQGAPFW